MTLEEIKKFRKDAEKPSTFLWSDSYCKTPVSETIELHFVPFRINSRLSGTIQLASIGGYGLYATAFIKPTTSDEWVEEFINNTIERTSDDV